MSPRALAPKALALAASLLSLTACTSSTPTPSDAYSFKAAGSAVNVDTPALRKQKAAAGIAACPNTSASPTPVDKGLPDITLPCLGGGDAVHLAGLRGTPAVLNFWAQTCGPCRTESPMFQQLHEKAAGDLAVLGVDFLDPLPSRAIAFADELGLTYPQVADPEGATRAPMRVSGLPLTVFVDAGGAVVHAEYGPISSIGDLTGLVKDYLGVNVILQ
ncbi:MAG: TlpA disulfide reductase family protein [Nocardioidaceae bacterium]